MGVRERSQPLADGWRGDAHLLRRGSEVAELHQECEECKIGEGVHSGYSVVEGNNEVSHATSFR